MVPYDIGDVDGDLINMWKKMALIEISREKTYTRNWKGFLKFTLAKNLSLEYINQYENNLKIMQKLYPINSKESNLATINQDVA